MDCERPSRLLAQWLVQLRLSLPFMILGTVWAAYGRLFEIIYTTCVFRHMISASSWSEQW